MKTILLLLVLIAGGAVAQSATPDVILVSFSGRTGLPALGHCIPGQCPPRDNTPYLRDPEWRTVQSLEAVFRTQGLDVVTFHASSFVAAHRSYLSGQDEAGYIEAEAFLLEAYAQFIRDRDSPAKVVLVGHSHGVVWASLLAWNHPEVPIHYLISLDSVCTGWTADHLPYIVHHYGTNPDQYPWPLNEHQDPCDVTLGGLSVARAVTDLVPDNVLYNLEVQSARPFLDPRLWLEDRARDLVENPPTLQDVERFLATVHERARMMSDAIDSFARNVRPSDLLDSETYRRELEQFLAQDWTVWLGLGYTALQEVLNPFHDRVSNIRPDGRQEGLYVYTSESETHSEVTFYTSAAMCWLREAVRALEQGRPPGDDHRCDGVLSL